jgi:hypothetical protein
MAEVVRTAIRGQRKKQEEPLEKLLSKTSGIWRNGDGLKYQRRIRSEWK